jgi:hypothetical protein
MRFIPTKASYPSALVRDANDQDKATLFEVILSMADKAGVVIVTSHPQGGYTFEQKPREFIFPEFAEPTPAEVKRIRRALEPSNLDRTLSSPRTIESDLREDR